MQIRTLLRATRAYSLPASVVPVLLGTVLAVRGLGDVPPTRINWAIFLLVLIGAILSHVGANVLNDYFDFMKGVDTRPEHGSGVITGGEMTARQALVFSLLLLAGAAFCGLALLRTHPAFVFTLVMIGLGCAVFYSASLKSFALGEPLIVLSFGLGLTIGAYGVQASEVTARGCWLAALYSVPICLLVDAILHANNLRDAEDDRGAKVRTMANLVSRKTGERWQLVLLFGPLGFVVAGIIAGWLPVWSLVTLLATPLLVRAARTGSVEGTAQTHLIFGVLYVASLLLRP
jgi:1,4-dihydroxy-2-naphthoate polyprenyltransferase